MALEMQKCLPTNITEFRKLDGTQPVFSRFKSLQVIEHRVLMFVCQLIPASAVRLEILVHG